MLIYVKKYRSSIKYETKSNEEKKAYWTTFVERAKQGIYVTIINPETKEIKVYAYAPGLVLAQNYIEK